MNSGSAAGIALTLFDGRINVVKSIIANCLLAAALISANHSVQAQQPVKSVRIAIAMAGTPETMRYRVEAFLQGMRDLGYVEGKNLQIDYRYTGGNPARRLEVASEVVRLKPDVIVVSSTGLTDAIRKATNTIPIVVGNAGDLVGTGVVASLARPGGNVTGSTDMAADLAAKRLELVREFVPKLNRLGVILYGSPTGLYSDAQEFKQLDAAGQQLGITIHPMSVREPKDFQPTFAALRAQKTDAIIIIQGPFTFQHNRELSELALKNRLPIVCEESVWVENGCLISYGPDKAHSFRRAAVFVDKIVKGARPADLPVEQPIRFEMAFNLKTARTLGLAVPQTILVRATRVVE